MCARGFSYFRENVVCMSCPCVELKESQSAAKRRHGECFKFDEWDTHHRCASFIKNSFGKPGMEKSIAFSIPGYLFTP